MQAEKRRACILTQDVSERGRWNILAPFSRVSIMEELQSHRLASRFSRWTLAKAACWQNSGRRDDCQLVKCTR